MSNQLRYFALMEHKNEGIEIASIRSSEYVQSISSHNRIVGYQSLFELYRIRDLTFSYIDLHDSLIRRMRETAASNNRQKGALCIVEQTFSGEVSAVLPDIALILWTINAYFLPFVFFLVALELHFVEISW